MGFAEINSAIQSKGGTFVNLKEVGDQVSGTIVAEPEIRDQVFKGAIVPITKGPNAGKPRKEWVFTLKTSEGNVVKVGMKESAQWALSGALAGRTMELGGHIQLTIVKKETMQQPEFKAVYTAPSKEFDFPAQEDTPVTAVADDDEPPF